MRSSTTFLIAQFVLVALLSLVQCQVLFMAPEDKRNFDRDFMHFGKRSAGGAEAMERHFMNFGKRADDEFGRAFMPFGKRFVPLEDVLLDKKNFNRDFMHFGKRAGADDFERNFMSFGKRYGGRTGNGS
ncbi:AF17 protein [Aphelenchoides avenae]|nr:AF17 protein [Aphelenchus avenae]